MAAHLSPTARGALLTPPRDLHWSLILVFLATTALAFTGLPVVAAVGPALGAGLLVLRPDLIRHRAPMLVLLAALAVAVVFACTIHPSAATPGLILTFAASAVLSLALSAVSRTTSFGIALGLCSALAIGALAYATAVGPTALTDKSPLARLLLGARAPTLIHGLPYLHPNAAGVLAALSGAACFGIAFGRRPLPMRLPVIGLGCVELAVLAFSGSRAGLLALATAVVALAVLRWRLLGWLLLALAAAAGLVVLLDPPALGRMGVLAIAIAGPRPQIWSGTLHGLLQSAITGYGPGQFPFAYLRSPTAPDAAGAHNTYLQAWVDLGLPGLAAVVAITADALRRSIRDFEADAVGLALLATTVAWIVHSFFEAGVVVTISPIGWSEPWQTWQTFIVPALFVLWGVTCTHPPQRTKPSNQGPLPGAV